MIKLWKAGAVRCPWSLVIPYNTKPNFKTANPLLFLLAYNA